MKKFIVLAVVVLIGGAVFLFRDNSKEYTSVAWTDIGEGRYLTAESSGGVLLIGDSTQKKIIGRIEVKKIQGVLTDGDNQERYEIKDRIINPRRTEIYFFINDKQGVGGPYVGASVHVVSSRFDGSLIKDIATLDGYDMPHVTLSEDGTKLRVEQLMKQGPGVDDISLEKSELDIAELQKE